MVSSFAPPFFFAILKTLLTSKSSSMETTSSLMISRMSVARFERVIFKKKFCVSAISPKTDIFSRRRVPVEKKKEIVDFIQPTRC